MQVVKVTFQDGYSHKFDANVAVQPGTYSPYNVPESVGREVARFLRTREEIVRGHGRVKNVEIRQYQPVKV